MATGQTDSTRAVVTDTWEPAGEDQGDEYLGARIKKWLTDPSDGTTWLWKETRAGGLPQPGADLWAEVVAAEVARLLDIPAARVRFATRGTVRGVISARIAEDLVHGNELLFRRNPTYDVQRRGAVAGYDLNRIREALEAYSGYPGQALSCAFNAFVALLTFDAVIANTDRHHENWAIIESTRRLSPSYDHGASLGFNVPLVPDVELTKEKVLSVARKARSRHFPGKPALVDLARDALECIPVIEKEYILSRVGSLPLNDLARFVSAVPRDWMSEVAGTFVLGLVSENIRRLLA